MQPLCLAVMITAVVVERAGLTNAATASEFKFIKVEYLLKVTGSRFTIIMYRYKFSCAVRDEPAIPTRAGCHSAQIYNCGALRRQLRLAFSIRCFDSKRFAKASRNTVKTQS